MEQPQNPALPFPEELSRLAEVRRQIATALETAEADVRKHQKDYGEFMEYIAGHRGEIDPKEIFQSEMLLEQEGFAGMFALQNRDAMARLSASPYFARVDFAHRDDGKTGIYYVGRATFRDGAGHILVHDWRAPVSSMFYDYELGPAAFNTPQGTVEGTLERKRQFKITNGEMEYALESSLTIQDDVLQKELSQTSDEKMRSIISTIQKEQNEIIRDETDPILIIQGVAGSGKTSIALHRIAYLLYRFKDTLTASNVVILSPNKVFADHIGGVLPELGEQPVYQMGLRQLADIQLEGVLGFFPERDALETEDPAWAERTRYKSSAGFLRDMERFMAHAEQTVFVPEDAEFEFFSVDKDWIWGRYKAYARYPIRRRLREIEEDMRDRFISRNIQGDPIPPIREIRKKLNAMLKTRTTLALYKEMFRWLGKPRYLVVSKGSVEWDDVYPFLYLHAFFTGLRENHRIRHFVVDEMQDYTPVQHAVLKSLFDCKMTILGDFSQGVDPNKSHTLEDLCALYPTARLMRLEKSYRSTCEIIAFAGAIKRDTKLKVIQRHGDKPTVQGYKDEAAELAALRGILDGFEAGNSVTLGILLKNSAEAEALHAKLSETHTVNLVTRDSEQFTAGASVMGIGMSKGLEFDEVVIPHADDSTYHAEHDRSLLYVACTRAMHRLTVLHTGKRSRLLP